MKRHVNKVMWLHDTWNAKRLLEKKKKKFYFAEQIKTNEFGLENTSSYNKSLSLSLSLSPTLCVRVCVVSCYVPVDSWSK